MIIRGLDSDHDWQFGRSIQDFKRDQAAIMENIQTRLLSWVNDCFFDINAGVDWRRLLAAPSTQAELVLSCRAVIMQSYGVVAMRKMSASVVNRSASLEFTIDTIFTSNFKSRLEVL